LSSGRRAEDFGLGRRLRQPRTVISFAVPVLLLVLALRSLPGFEVDRLPDRLLHASPVFLALALACYYLTFPIRGHRWRLLLRGAGDEIGLADATEIVFLSWFVNCLVPAKLGDVYRAYLMRLNGGLSLGRTFGTVFMERVLDLVVLGLLAGGLGYLSFGRDLPAEVRVVIVVAGIVIACLVVGLMLLRGLGTRIVARLPLPVRAQSAYARFETGAFAAVSRRSLPGLVALTILIWTAEIGHLLLVVQALDFPDVHVGLAGIAFVALAGALLTAVPFTPAGLGIVEAGSVGILTVVFAVPAPEAAAIVLVDRAVTILSLLVSGAVVYALSGKPRGRGLRRPRHTMVPRHTVATLVVPSPTIES
jgi:hypothetical protein